MRSKDSLMRIRADLRAAYDNTSGIIEEMVGRDTYPLIDEAADPFSLYICIEVERIRGAIAHLKDNVHNEIITLSSAAEPIPDPPSAVLISNLAHEDDIDSPLFNSLLAVLQDEIGQIDGGWAALYFDGSKQMEWQDSTWLRRTQIIKDYVAKEVERLASDAEFGSAQDPLNLYGKKGQTAVDAADHAQGIPRR